MKFLNKLMKILKAAIDLLKCHYKAFCLIDPLSDCSENLSRNSQNRHFIFAITDILIFMFGIFLLEYEEKLGIHLDESLSSQYQFIHQILPKPIWKLAKIALTINASMTIIIYIVLIVNPSVKQSFRLSTDGQNVFIGFKILDRHISSRILQYRSRLKSIFKSIFAHIIFIGVFFEFHVLFINNSLHRNCDDALVT